MTTFLGLEPQFADPSRAAVGILPVPYDLTSTYVKGSDKGPAAIIEASTQVELYDIPTRSETYRRGIATLDPIEFDGSPDDLADIVQNRISEIFESNQIPIVLGGEHSVSIGAIRAAADSANGRLSVLQIDAHGDTRDEYHGSKCNHACVMARAREVADIVQVGIRAIDAEEVNGLDESRVFYAHDIVGTPHDSWMDRVVDLLTDDVYITIDLDAFDPSIIPATGTPEPGGLDWYTVNELLRRVIERRTVHSFDVVELCPMPNEHASAFIAAKLVYRMLSMMLR